MMVGGGEMHSLVTAPALSEVYRLEVERPAWDRGTALAVDPLLWRQAHDELRDVLASRGWPVSTSAELARKHVTHFLLYGVPIVMGDR